MKKKGRFVCIDLRIIKAQLSCLLQAQIVKLQKENQALRRANSKINKVVRQRWAHATGQGKIYKRDPNKSGGGTQLLHALPTAHMVHSISSLTVAVDTLGGYNWRHHGDFSISTFNPLKGPNLDQNLRKKIIQFFFGFWGGLKGFRVEIEKSPWWRQFYPPKLSTAAAIVEID